MPATLSLLFSPGPHLAQSSPFKAHQRVVPCSLSKLTLMTPPHELVSQLFLLPFCFSFWAEPRGLHNLSMYYFILWLFPKNESVCLTLCKHNMIYAQQLFLWKTRILVYARNRITIHDQSSIKTLNILSLINSLGYYFHFSWRLFEFFLLIYMSLLYNSFLVHKLKEDIWQGEKCWFLRTYYAHRRQ